MWHLCDFTFEIQGDNSRGEDSYEILVQVVMYLSYSCCQLFVNTKYFRQKVPHNYVLHDVNSLYIWGIKFRYVIPGPYLPSGK